MASGFWSKVRRATFWSIFAGVNWVIAPIILQTDASDRSPRVTNLEEVVQEEMANLNMGDHIVVLAGQYETSASGKLANDPLSMYFPEQVEDNSYIIYLTEEHRNRSIIRHELYHIADGHVDDGARVGAEYGDGGFQLFYYLLYEPQASIYSVFDIKL